jgi:hypothetical protein
MMSKSCIAAVAEQPTRGRQVCRVRRRSGRASPRGWCGRSPFHRRRSRPAAAGSRVEAPLEADVHRDSQRGFEVARARWCSPRLRGRPASRRRWEGPRQAPRRTSASACAGVAEVTTSASRSAASGGRRGPGRPVWPRSAATLAADSRTTSVTTSPSTPGRPSEGLCVEGADPAGAGDPMRMGESLSVRVGQKFRAAAGPMPVVVQDSRTQACAGSSQMSHARSGPGPAMTLR